MQPPWERLTKAEATNYLITALILMGADTKRVLVIDGDPGRVLEGVLATFDRDTIFSTMESKKSGDPFPAIRMFRAITRVARSLGYFEDTLSGLAGYLRSLPEVPPVE